MGSVKTVNVAIRAESVLRFGDDGFEEAARKHGLWVLSDSGESGVLETLVHMAPDADLFEETLRGVLGGSSHAVVRVRDRNG